MDATCKAEGMIDGSRYARLKRLGTDLADSAKALLRSNGDSMVVGASVVTYTLSDYANAASQGLGGAWLYYAIFGVYAARKLASWRRERKERNDPERKSKLVKRAEKYEGEAVDIYMQAELARSKGALREGDLAPITAARLLASASEAYGAAGLQDRAVNAGREAAKVCERYGLRLTEAGWR